MGSARAFSSLTDAPPIVPAPFRTGVGERVFAGFVAAACLAVLVVAACLEPSPAGHGTHEALGLPRCGWVISMNKPCPTCGMTTAFAHAVRWQLIPAAQSQPMGLVLAVLTSAGFWVSLHVAATGSRLHRIGATMVRPRGLWSLAALFGAAWAYRLLTWQGG